MQMWSILGSICWCDLEGQDLKMSRKQHGIGGFLHGLVVAVV